MTQVPIPPTLTIALPTTGQRNIFAVLAEIRTQVKESGVNSALLVLHNTLEAEPGLRQLVEDHGGTYNHVPELGYAHVRNAALAAARGGDFLVFIDDDEVPDPGWLNAHLSALDEWRADVVFGPVRTVVPPGAPRWIDGGKLLRESATQADGPTDGRVYSGNTSIRLAFVEGERLHFDNQFNQTGGEDTDFFMRCRTAGACIVWCSRASVTETADPERVSLRWMLRRSYRSARNNVIYLRAEHQHSGLPILLRKFAQIGRGLVRCALGCLTFNSATIARGARDFALSMGAISGLSSDHLKRRTQ